MEKFEKTVRPILRVLGFTMVVVGVVTAAYDKAFAGFMPFMWFLLAICAFLGVICTLLLSMERRSVR